ncbi:MAG: acyl-CoA dehydrogenase family protein [Steroidobacteraceae bacterium]
MRPATLVNDASRTAAQDRAPVTCTPRDLNVARVFTPRSGSPEPSHDGLLALRRRAAFRDDLRAWLAANPPPHAAILDRVGRSEDHPGADDGRLGEAARQRKLARPRVAEEYGGRGLGLVEQMIFYDETAPLDPPQLGQMVGLGVIGPTLLRYGSDAQKRYRASSAPTTCGASASPSPARDPTWRRCAAPRSPAVTAVLSGSKIWTSHRWRGGAHLLLRTEQLSTTTGSACS